jgi:hypothetical protein
MCVRDKEHDGTGGEILKKIILPLLLLCGLAHADISNPSSIYSTIDVNGGTIDGATIGGTTPGAGTFTEVNVSSSAGVKITGDGDGAITFLGMGNGSDEDLTLNLDDTSNVGTFTSSTSLATLNFSSIALQETGVGVLNNDEIDASSELLAIMDDETGTGALAFATSPTFTTSILLPSASMTVGGANQPGWMNNCALKRASVTNGWDSVSLTSAGGTALSATNVCSIGMPSTTAGQTTVFFVTADVTLTPTGVTWTLNPGDTTGTLIRWVSVNDNGTLRHCLAFIGGRGSVLTTDTTTTAANVDTAEEMFCNAAVGSATNTAMELGFARADFDTTGGAAENLFQIQSGANDLVTGKSPDCMWQPFTTTATGFSSGPSVAISKFMQCGRTITYLYENTTGTSNATTFTLLLPAKAYLSSTSLLGQARDSGAEQADPARIDLAAGSTTATLYKTLAGGAWTNTGTKGARFQIDYEVGPSTSFID